MQTIRLGNGQYIISPGTRKTTEEPCVFFEPVAEARPVGLRADMKPLSENAIAITFANKEAAFVLIEQIAKTFLV